MTRAMTTILRGGRRHVHVASDAASDLASGLGLLGLGLVLLLGTACGESGPRDGPPLTPAEMPPGSRPAPDLERLDLDGIWSLLLDPEGVGREAGWAGQISAGEAPRQALSAAFPIEVPGPLEGAPQTALYDLGAARGYDGRVWYHRRFVAPDGVETARARLRFERVNYACTVWLDGREVGAHEGGYEAFTLDLTGRLESGGRHDLVVMVVDPGEAEVEGWTLRTTPHSKESWYHNWGGLLGSVNLDLHRAPALEDLSVVPNRQAGDLAVSFTLLVPPGFAETSVTVELSVAGDASKRVEVPFELERQGAVRRLTAVRLALENPRRWTPREPVLHSLTTRVAGRTGPALDFGFSPLEVRDGNLFVGGQRRVLKGVLFQPHFTGTNGMPPDAASLDAEVAAMLDTGFDFVRVHVRPAPEAFLDACDRRGLMVIEEPAIGWVQDSPDLPARLRAEIDHMLARDARHPSVVMWGLLNELSGRSFLYADALVSHLASRDPDRVVLEDSGGFHGGGRLRLPGEAASRPMVDDHAYPPYPLPLDERERLRGLHSLAGGPVFVSEYGYGTLLDTGRAVAGFSERGAHGAHGEEAVLFMTQHSQRQALLKAGGHGRDDGWVREAAVLQADAAEDMTEALRSNPELDLLCYTQWRAVSTEASAGVLDVWGESRPVRGRLARALRPLMTAVFPAASSLTNWSSTAVEVVVVNDTGRAISATLELRRTRGAQAGEVLGTWAGPFGPGVTSRVVEWQADGVGTHELVARLLPEDASALAGAEPLPLDVSTSRRVQVFGATPAAWLPGVDRAPVAARAFGDVARGQAFLKRQGFALPDAGSSLPVPDVLLVTNSEVLASGPLSDRLDVWHFVRTGGAAVVLLPDPGERPLDAAFGTRRVARLLKGLPLTAVLSHAPGNFLGRVHVAHAAVDTDALVPTSEAALLPGHRLRLLGRGDEALSPRGLLAKEPRGEAQAAILTLGHTGSLAGSPWVALPYGAGELLCIGLPLFDNPGGAADARREHVLAQALIWAGERARSRAAGSRAIWRGRPRGEDELEASLAADFLRLESWLDLGSRYGPLSGGAGGARRLPPVLRQVLADREAVLAAWLDGDVTHAATLLKASLERSQLSVAGEFMQLESGVAASLSAALKAVDPTRRSTGLEAGRTYDALQAWARGLRAFFAGQIEAALAELGTARGLLMQPPLPVGMPSAGKGRQG